MKNFSIKLSFIIFGCLILSPPLLHAQVIDNQIDNTCSVIDQSCDDRNPCTQDQCNFRRVVDSIVAPLQSVCVFSCNNPPQFVAGGTCSQDCQFTPLNLVSPQIEDRIRFAPCNNNGVLDPGEQCDGENLNGQSCATLFPGQTGLLRCENCQFNTANCQNPISVDVFVQQCGNGVPEGNEGCDDGNRINGDGCNENCILETTAIPPAGTAATCSSAADCNDNNGCTTDLCLPSGQAVPGGFSPSFCSNPPVNTDDGNSCTTDSCDPATGTINHAAIPNCPPATCGDGTVNQPTEECDFAAEGETPETCDQNCKKVVPVLAASCRCDDSEDRVTKGGCAEEGVECCIPIRKDGKRSTFTCDLTVSGGTSSAALSLQQKVLSNATILWLQTGGKNTIKSVVSGQGADERREGAVVLQSISIPAGGAEQPATSIKAFAPIPAGDGKNFETYQLTVMAGELTANAPINFAIEASGGGGAGGCSLIR